MDYAEVNRRYRTSAHPKGAALACCGGENPCDDLEKSLAYFSQVESIDISIKKSALSEINGARHPHQRRLKLSALQEFGDALREKGDKIEKCTSFDELIKISKLAASRVKGIGPLTEYDVAMRIACYLKLKSYFVYVQSGSNIGAKSMGLIPNKGRINRSDFPSELVEGIDNFHVENLLCIYRNHLRRA